MALFRQLAIVRQQIRPHSSHLLVCSTAPHNAEEGSLQLPLSDGARLVTDDHQQPFNDLTDETLREMRASLGGFLGTIRERHANGEDFLASLQGRLKLVLNIHGYSTPLQNFSRKAFRISDEKFSKDSQIKAERNESYEDYVIFIDYSWPSEQALSLPLSSVFAAMPFLLQVVLIIGLALGVVSLGLGVALARGLQQLTAAAAPLQAAADQIPAALAKVFGSLLIGWGSGLLLGIALTLVLLRLVTYFRDRERAASAAVYDGVDLVRWMHQIVLEEISELVQPTARSTREERLAFVRSRLRATEHSQRPDQASPPAKAVIELSILAHSMGCFVATQLVRTLSDVFDPLALERWLRSGGEGPFQNCDPCPPEPAVANSEEAGSLSGRRIGDLFVLGRLVLASADIPVWALTNGRSNPLQACLRRFDEVFLFSNDADLVLKLISTLANFFVFPSNSREGGYRLGNVVPLHSEAGWGLSSKDLGGIGLYGKRGTGGRTRSLPLSGPPFLARQVLSHRLQLIDCSDYIDQRCGMQGSAELRPRLAAPAQRWRPLRYLKTFLAWTAPWISPERRLDPHGGYFQGPFCLDLIYYLLLFGSGRIDQEPSLSPIQDKLVRHQISWIRLTNPPSC